MTANVVGGVNSRRGYKGAGYKGPGRTTFLAPSVSASWGVDTTVCPAVVPRGVNVGFGDPFTQVSAVATMGGRDGTGIRFSFTVFAPIPTDRDPVGVVAKPVAANKGEHSVGLVPYRLAGTLVAG